jgi:cytidylate kinase
LVDETESNWVYDVLGTWMDHKIVPHETFVAHLVPTIIAAARRGPTVFVGRGAQFVLPRHRGLAVRLVASWRYRVERVMREQNLGATAARHWIEQRDRGCREFIQRFFHHDPNDPHLYDLVLNVERYEPHGAATAILAALQARALAS